MPKLKSGLSLKLSIAESNLEASIKETERVKTKLAEVLNERDFLRRVVLNLSETKRYA